MSGCDRELNAHFYSAASLKYHVPDTWHDTIPSHIILTLGRPVLALPPKVWVPSEEQLVPFFTTLVCRGSGSNPWPSIPRSGHSTELPGPVEERGINLRPKGWCGAWFESNHVIIYLSLIYSKIWKFPRFINFPLSSLLAVSCRLSPFGS